MRRKRRAEDREPTDWNRERGPARPNGSRCPERLEQGGRHRVTAGSADWLHLHYWCGLDPVGTEDSNDLTPIIWPAYG